MSKTVLEYSYTIDVLCSELLNGNISFEKWAEQGSPCLYVTYTSSFITNEDNFVVHLNDLEEYLDRGISREELTEDFICGTFEKMLADENYIENIFLGSPLFYEVVELEYDSNNVPNRSSLCFGALMSNRDISRISESELKEILVGEGMIDEDNTNGYSLIPYANLEDLLQSFGVADLNELNENYKFGTVI